MQSFADRLKNLLPHGTVITDYECRPAPVPATGSQTSSSWFAPSTADMTFDKGMEAYFKTASDAALTMLRESDPFFRSRPVYIVRRTNFSKWHFPEWGPEANGYFGRDLDLTLQSYLEARGEWRGRGLATVIDEKCGGFSNAAFIGCVTHEASHMLEAEAADAQLGHGPLFIRAALHLHFRANVWLRSHGYQRIDFLDVMHMPFYGRTLHGRYSAALIFEQFDSSKPILDHLRTHPPCEWRELCNQEAERLGEPRPY